MNEQEIKIRRKLLSDKAYALKELMECGDLSYDEYSQEIARIQIERRKLKNANVIDVEIVSVDEPSKPGGMEDGSLHLPAVIAAQPSEPNEHTARDWSKYAEPQRRCRAHKKNGEQCGNASILGSTVCRYHGGASKHVKQAARARIENATDRMAKELLGMAIDPDMAPAVKLSAIKDALDRGGLKAPEKVVLSAGAQSGFEEIFDDIASGSRAESRAARGITDDMFDSIRSHCDPLINPTVPQPDNEAAPAYRPNDVGRQDGSIPQDESGIQFDKSPYSPLADSQPNDGPIPRPSHRQGRERPRERQSGRHITGEAALHLAAELRGLPRGSE